MRNINVGLFGFGVVGGGIYKVLEAKPQLGVSIKKIVIKNPEKEREAPLNLFYTDANEIIEDDNLQLVVELIDDSEAAYQIVKRSFEKGKSVISANKKMIAEHHEELIALSQTNGVSFLYEAAVCGSVPIIRNLEEYFDNDLLTHVKGIVNGSTNFILTQMSKYQSSYSEALQLAQEKGFAESNPLLDVEGFDAAYKLSIIALHAFGAKVKQNDIIKKGITSIHQNDLIYAKEKGFQLKLIAQAVVNEQGQASLFSIIPSFVERSNPLGLTNNEYNGVLVGSTLADEQFFYGKGAGRFPTSSAVLSDISAYKYGYKYEFKKGRNNNLVEVVREGRFFLSFPSNKIVDLSDFKTIEESYQSANRNYVVGTLAYQKLKDHPFVNDASYSLIAFNE
ncbi:MAG: homoserine dehydrogenase [Bacteroidales bacterium]|nr:homoserine dehydrogenase [Bacteroidales bacterium]